MRDKTQLFLGILFLIGVIVVSFAFEDLFSFGALVILPLMTIVTAAARGYATKPTFRFAGCAVALAILGYVLICAAPLEPGGDVIPAIVAIIFAAVALRRAVWLARINRTGAATLAFVSLFFAGWSIAFCNYRAPWYEAELRRGIKEFVAYQLTFRERSPQRRFDPLAAEQIPARWPHAFASKTRSGMAPIAAIRTEYPASGDRFTILVNPGGTLPFMPYGFFTSWRVFRGDESGAIRSEQVRHARWCDANAPVIARVGDLRWLVVHDDETAPYAIDELEKFAGSDPVMVLIDALRNGTPATRKDAAFNLGLRHDPRATPALVAAIADRNNDVSSTASFAVGETHDQAALDLLAPMLENPQLTTRVRYQVAIAIGKIGGDRAASILTSALPRSRGLLTKSIIVGLGYTKSARAVAPLLEASTLADTDLRDTAAFALGQLKSPAVRPRLREMAKNDPSATVRDTAALYAND